MLMKSVDMSFAESSAACVSDISATDMDIYVVDICCGLWIRAVVLCIGG